MNKKSKRSNKIRIAAVLFLWLVVLGLIGFLAAFAYFSPQIPEPETIITRRVSESTKILDREGKTVLFSVHGDEKRTIVPMEEISDQMKNAVIAAEDSNFYSHSGIDLKGIGRAFFVNILARDPFSQGGSTITQQLVRNSLLGVQKTYSRKFKEAVLALQVERKFDKDQILWMYLNQIPFGSNIFGIEEASQRYFGKPAKDLTLNESATLAAMIKAPSYFSPYGSHKDELIERKDFILSRMAELGYISEEEAATNKEEEVNLVSASESGLLAPHFSIVVREYLVEKYGEDLVQNGGLKVYTTLDWELQQKAEDIIEKYSQRNEDLFRAGNEALVALDPKTGEILALVGSRDYNYPGYGNFNVITAFRQPGSAFKPIVYSLALDKGLTDKTVVFDVKTEFNPLCPPDGNQEKDQYGLGCYHPQNSDEKYRGPVTLRQALGSSLNIPSVKVLYLAGVKESIERAENFGIKFIGNTDDFGLSLVLGGGDVRPLDLVSAYGIFANDGIHNRPNFILKIEDAKGNIIEEAEIEPERKLSAETARMMNDILSDNSARALLFGLSSPLYIAERPVAVKTGTTQKFRDAWTIGYAPSLVVGVWVGNNDNTEMTREGGGVSAGAPIWREFMIEALRDKPVSEFQKPGPVFVDKPMLNGNYIDGNGEGHTILHYISKEDPRGPIPENPGKDVQYNNWEQAVKNNY